MSRTHSILTRWLGVGLATVLAVVTLALAITGRLGLYINPDSTWFAVGMALFLVAGAIGSFLLPLGAEEEHGHDHGDGDGDGHDDEHDHAAAHRQHPVAAVATATGGVIASAVVLLVLLLPPTSLSAELALSRDIGAAPLFAGADVVNLASSGDTATFGVGEWSAVFASTTNPEAFDGAPVELTGFVTPADDGDFDLTRLVITHCVIDAQPASIPVVGDGGPDTGQWVTVTGTVRSSSDGRLAIDATTVEVIDEPEDPYEY
ncbi:TIGR03943 family putative permease subunit [Microbacterium thalassium]|uniref:Putative repeat protein (TIGR03943 family) n=1 Tax=Microbacterium thalassium TaxID=362649 RepID=A0A7X0FMV1_9MICO|nr:TIGR03943 family protein [Microbacterium thalassium]MBB6390399.1 putative repeat protein (TIGR03943 family) [Microbacterium thalassium]GLK25508.1 TIGR03943 family protein [Microbacterium thalassium]